MRLISGCSCCIRCIAFTPLKVSGRMTRRTVNVSRMIATPQLPSKSPSRSCQNLSTASQASTMGWTIEAMTMAVGPLRAGTEELLVLHEVDAPVAPGIAAQHSPGGEDRAPQYAVAAKSLDGVLRAAGMV